MRAITAGIDERIRIKSWSRVGSCSRRRVSRTMTAAENFLLPGYKTDRPAEY
jgi:hypothetical protein